MRIFRKSSPTITAAAVAMYLIVGGIGCERHEAKDARADDERALRALDARWSEAAGAHDLNKTVSFYAGDAVLLPPDEPIATDSAAIRKSWAGTLGSLDSISWTVSRMEVARSGELAFLTGAWKARARSPIQVQSRCKSNCSKDGRSRQAETGSAPWIPSMPTLLPHRRLFPRNS